MLMFVAQCTGVLERVKREVRPMIMDRIKTMEVGASLNLQGLLAIRGED